MSELIKKDELNLYSKTADQQKIFEIEKRIEEEKKEVELLKDEMRRKQRGAIIKGIVFKSGINEADAFKLYELIKNNEIPNIFIKY